MANLSITSNKGFHINFDNGKTISIQIGGVNYCDNYNLIFSRQEGPPPPSSTAEIAIWDNEGWFSFDTATFSKDNSDVKGYVPINEVLDWINKVREMK